MHGQGGPGRQLQSLLTKGAAGDAIVPVTVMRVRKAWRMLVYLSYFSNSKAKSSIRTGEKYQ